MTSDGERGGATSVEMALLWMAMLALVLAVVQVALVFLAAQLALTAAEDGLRAGRYYRVASADLARREAEDFLARTAGSTLGSPRVAAVMSSDGATLQVTVSGTVLSVVPGVDLTVVKQATGAVEGVAP
jgi:Flp pilus assembly protein TadG